MVGGWRRWPTVSAVGLGVLSAAALPPVDAIPVLLLAVPGLLLLVSDRAGFWGAARVGFWFGFGHHLVGLYWITEAILVESTQYWWFVPIAVPALSALLAVFIGAAAGVARLMAPGWPRVLGFAGAWTLADLARQFIGTGFPWNPWGSVWAVPGWFGDVMLQPLAWVGTPGMTLATVALAGLPLLGWRGWSALAVVLVGWAGAGAWRLGQPAGAAPGVAAVLVQGDVAQGQKWDRGIAAATFERHLALSEAGVRQAGARPSVVIWPETASPYLLQNDAAARAAITEADGPALGAIVGSLRFQKGFPPATLTSDPANEPLNAMVAMDRSGGITGLYDKWHLVPFGEYPPSWVPFAIQIVPGHFGFGKGPATLRIPGLPPFGGLICYEAIFPGQVVDEADRPDWLVNITNDAWFGNSTGPRQHLAAVRMRAVEEGLPVMRAANTGISAGFDSRGRELGLLGVGEAGTLVLDLPGKDEPTIFSRGGLWIPGVIAFIVMGASGRSRYTGETVTEN